MKMTMPMTSVRKTTLQAIEDIKSVMGTLPWDEASFYGLWLAQTYFYVRNATRVLAKAAYRCTHEEEPMHKKLLQGINEEKNHEIMATNDLKTIGFTMNSFHEMPATTAYYQTLLAATDYDGPYALLGYFVTLEGLGAIGCDHVFDTTFAKFGKMATQFLRVHTRVDKHHFDDGIDYIETLPQDKQDLIERYVAVSSRLYINMLNEVKAEHKKFSPNLKSA
jgi:hypothetical protein